MQLKKRIYISMITAFLFCCGCALELTVDSHGDELAPVEAQHALLVVPANQQIDQNPPRSEMIGTYVAIRPAAAKYSWL